MYAVCVYVCMCVCVRVCVCVCGRNEEGIHILCSREGNSNKITFTMSIPVYTCEWKPCTSTHTVYTRNKFM